ncbi:MAG: coiled-coil protein, partial [Candidatus Syntropharchaeales archaeon]
MKHNMGSIKSFEELQKELDRLEFKQQVEVLKADKERQLVERITSLQKEFERRKREIAQNEKLKELLDKAQSLREEAHIYHEKVTSAAKVAQEHHDKMLSTFRRIDKVRKEADDAHRMFIKAQERADLEHKIFIKHQREIRDFDKLINGLKKKMREDYSFKDRIESKKKAKEVYGQFKRGEKLSTEDLLLLQRSWMG